MPFINENVLTVHISVLLSAKIRTGGGEPSRGLRVKGKYLHYQRLWEDDINIHGKFARMGAYARHTDEVRDV